MAEAEFTQIVSAVMKNPDCMLFDRFLIKKMLPDCQELHQKELPEELRWQAYHECMKRLGDTKVAALQTIQHWFGIHQTNRPSREALFRLGFALRLSVEEMEEYLKEGMGEIGFQMSDYSEVIYYYGLHNGYTWEMACSLIEQFELHMPMEMDICHQNFTNHLCNLFCEKITLSSREFLGWMERYSSYLKGYSMTSLQYLQRLRQGILDEIRWDAKRRLEDLLQETPYYRWRNQRKRIYMKPNRSIPNFLDSALAKETLSSSLAQSISELYKLTKLPADANEKLLMDLYASAWEHNKLSKEKKKRVCHRLHLHLMDQKYISELFSVGAQREKQLQLLSLRAHLMNENGACPKELWNKAYDMGYQGKKEKGALTEWVTKTLARQSQRCRRIQRSDLLTLAFHLQQLRFMRASGEAMADYDYRRERERFCELADPMLAACNMETMNPEKYLLDAALWCCYQPEEVYSFSDVIESLDYAG